MRAGRYTLEEPVGIDGSWVRYRAVHTVRGTFHLARVRMNAPAGSGERLAALVHVQRARADPRIVPLDRVLEAGSTLTVVSPWVDGCSLADGFLNAELTPWEADTVLASVRGAIQAAHSWGLQHGDLSPTRVLFVPVGPTVAIKVDGFGLAVVDRAPLDPAHDLAALDALATVLRGVTTPPPGRDLHPPLGPPAQSDWSAATSERVRAQPRGLEMDAGISAASWSGSADAQALPWWQRFLR